MALSYNLGYQESISVHPTCRQIFAGKPYSTFPQHLRMTHIKIELDLRKFSNGPFSETEKGFGVNPTPGVANVQGFHPLFHESDLAPLFHPLSALSLKETTFSGSTVAANVQETNYHLSLVPPIAINSKDAKACIASAVNRSSFTQVTAFVRLLIPIGILQEQ